MTVLATESARLGDTLKWEETGAYSRDTSTLLSGVVVAGEALTGDSATGYAPVEDDVLAMTAIAAEGVDASGGAVKIAVIARDAQIGQNALVIGGTGTLAKATTDLAAKGILVREQLTDYSF